MITEKIIISDANIIFDLLSADLLSSFFELPCEFATTDFVIGEIKQPEQSEQVKKFVDANRLKVTGFSYAELIEINLICQNNDNNASFADCSVWYYAKKINGRLLTGDAKLRRAAEKDNVKVSGVLYVFDNLVAYGIISEKTAAAKLEKLFNVNNRLPRGEIEKRIKKWQKTV